MSSDYERRRQLTFAQSEGAVPLPTQLDRQNVSSELRARIWAVVYQQVMTDRFREGPRLGRYHYRLNWTWKKFWTEKNINFDHKLIDEVSDSVEIFINEMKGHFFSNNYLIFYGIIQFIIRSDNAPKSLKDSIEVELEKCLSPYRVIGGDTLVPFGNIHELGTFEEAGNALSNMQMVAPLAHLKRSAAFLGDGKFADSVRESISAIESLVRLIDSSNNVSSALNSLSRSGHIHQSMNEAFKKLYGYASDEQGIRHALLDDGDAKVTEADAMFMLGACAAFTTYLSANARKAGLI